MSDELKEFFLVTPIHFEEWAKKELLEKANFVVDVKEEKGGVTFKAPLSQGLELNYHLKIPTKILLRIEQFKARDFPKLYNSLLKLPWRNYLKKEIPKVHVTAHKSRLMNTTRISEVVIDALNRFNIMFPPKQRKIDEESVTQEIYLRLVDDLCQVSIDTSGERLHKRSYREFTGHAPIRENLAAGLIYATTNKLEAPPEILIDPMCGTGTFLAETKTFYSPNHSRGFHFEDFPYYKKSLKKIEYPDHFSKIKLNGFDIDPEVIKKNKIQLQSFEIDLNVGDAFKFVQGKSNSMIILNPPYGKRVKIEGSQKEYFELLLSQLLEKNQPRILGILIPQSVPIKNYSGYLEETINFKNGGIDIKFKIFKRINKS
jgi:putative N6-adenine-specific DNA methylase